jgi:exopolysaccharide biosynthesis polyprenyl glycosylphosphotransferase
MEPLGEEMVKLAPSGTKVMRLYDLCILTLAMPVAYYARDWMLGASRPGVYPLEHYWPPLSVTLLLWIAASWMFEVYVSYRTRSIGTEVARITRAVAAVGVLMTGLGFLSKQHDVSRLFVGLYFAIALVALVASRIGARHLAWAVRRRGRNTRIYAVVGTGDLAEDIVQSLAEHHEWGYDFAGYIVPTSDSSPQTGPLLGRLEELGTLLETRVLDEIIFALPRERLPEMEKSILLCQEQGVLVRICLDVLRNTVARMTLGEIEGVPTLTFSRTPSDTLALAAKRGFDIMVSATVLLMLSPVLIAVALAIKLDTRGPVLFRQRRVGLNGRTFDVLKFRSMHLDAEERLEELRRHNEMSGPVFKMRNDPRVTRVGRFLRRTSLDEFPQFWNVLSGEMSVVGPRPPLPSEVRQYKRWQRRRLSMRPGITCTWQVSGRNNIDFDRWMELDLAYIDHWSLWKDFAICAKTIPAVLGARGAS